MIDKFCQNSTRSLTDEITSFIQSVEYAEDLGELCIRPKNAYAFSGFQEYQCALCPYY